MAIIRQRKPIRQDTATIAELARVGNMSPIKLLNCVKETFPQAVMQSPVAASGLRLAFSNYEKTHNIKQGDPAPSALATGDTAPVETGDYSTQKVNTMNKDFYDEHGTDKESERQWSNDPNIRAEFHNDFVAFQHFRRAEAQGLIRFLGSK